MLGSNAHAAQPQLTSAASVVAQLRKPVQRGEDHEASAQERRRLESLEKWEVCSCILRHARAMDTDALPVLITRHMGCGCLLPWNLSWGPFLQILAGRESCWCPAGIQTVMLAWPVPGHHSQAGRQRGGSH